MMMASEASMSGKKYLKSVSARVRLDADYTVLWYE
jgi:hypothetical protein